MCGILGVIGKKSERIAVSDVLRASNAIRHRGPDDEGFLLVTGGKKSVISCGGEDTDKRLNLPSIRDYSESSISVALAHRRLSILDLSPAGHQPMRSGDGRYWIVYNGEVYNYIELKNELSNIGYCFVTGTDTEVILAAYQAWGAEMLSRFVGMFAIAILDITAGNLFLARDFFGIKPLYYSFADNVFAFASEIKSLLCLPAVSSKINPSCAYDYLRYGMTDHGNDTFFKDISQLPPAHFMQISLESLEQSDPVRYWQIDLNNYADISLNDAADQLRSMFLENVRLHLRSDVPVGAALSGGIDSSAIVMSMRHIEPEAQIHSFTYVADDAALNEEKWADLISSTGNITAHKVSPSQEHLTEDLDRLIAIQDIPFGSTSIYAQHCVFRLAKQAGIKVMLDGQGADELLGGYPSYFPARFASLVRNLRFVKAYTFAKSIHQNRNYTYNHLIPRAGSILLPKSARPLARKLVSQEIVPDWLNQRWFDDVGFDIVEPDIKYNNRLFISHLHESMTKGLVSLLRYEDRNSMAHSIESRVPFLTPQIAQFIYSLPDDYLIDPKGLSKCVFRKAMRGIVPDAVLDRQDKIGFATPEQKWLKNLKPWVEDIFSNESINKIPVFNREKLLSNWQSMIEGRQTMDFRLWRWINFIRWTDVYEVDFN